MTGLRWIVVALATAGCARQADAASYTAGDSMVPNIAVGESVAPGSEPAVRGRVVVFRWENNPEHVYVKRVIGIAGDTIAANGTEISVNGVAIRGCRVGAWSFDGHAGDLWLEALDGASWLVYHDSTKTIAERGPWKVAPGEVFVVGDNRENVTDSRKWFGGKGGGLPTGWIVGTASAAAPRLPAGAQQLQAAFDACARQVGAVVGRTGT